MRHRDSLMTSWERQPHTQMGQHAADSTNGFLGTTATGLHDTPALCVCVLLSQCGADIHDVTAGLGQAGIAMVMSSACLCVCVLLPPNLGGGLLPSLSILPGLICILWFPASVWTPLLIARLRHAYRRAGTWLTPQARKYPSYWGRTAALERPQSTCWCGE